MELHKMLDDLEELLCKDIKSVIAKGDIEPKDYECLDTAVDILKDAETIKAMPNYGEDEYGAVSGAMNHRRMIPMEGNGWQSFEGGNSGYYPMNSYDDGNGAGMNSGARGRSATTGRYVSRDNGANARLERMLMETNDPAERAVISRMLNEGMR